MTDSIVNADINSAAAIAYSKLALTGSIVNADISASAAIAFSKLAALTSGNILVGNVSNVATSVAMSGDTTISNAGVVAIGANKVTNAQLAQVATATFKGRTTASTGNVEDLTATQATALLNNFVGDSGSGGTKGVVPAPASGDAAAGKFLKADGSWVAPSGSGDVVGPASSTNNGFVKFNGTTGKLLKDSPATIVNADVDAAAAIAYSKLALTGGIVNADINASAAIAYSKLALTGAILNADISASAAIAWSKMANLTVDRALISDGSGDVSAATTTATEIGYVNGVTSAIQTQMNLKAPSASPTFTGTVTVPATITANGNVQTFPGSAQTLVGRTTTDTLTNKTLTTPTMTGPIVTTTAMDLQVGQIAFPATQNPSANVNTLDDYEEGEWTAFFTSGSGSITIDTNNRTGGYVKIGRMVTVTGQFIVSSVSSPSGNVSLGGLPFAIGNITQLAERASVTYRADGFTTLAVTTWQGVAIAGATTLTVETYSAGASTSSGGFFQANCTVAVNCTYFT